MGAFDDLIAEAQTSQAPAGGAFADLIAEAQKAPPRIQDALTLPPGLQRNQPYTGPTLGEAIPRTIAGFGQMIGASLQGTDPTVQRAGGQMNYQPLGEAGPLDSGGIGWIDAGGMHRIEPDKHVILNDPQTGKPMAYARSPEDTTLSGNLSAIGRLLGFGMMAPSNLPSPSTGISIGQAIRSRFGSSEDRALSHIGSAMRSDTAASGPGPLEIFDKLTATDRPMTVLDVSGENVRGLGGKVARLPGPGRQDIIQTLGERDVQSGMRMAQDVNDMAASGPGNFLASRSLHEQAQQAASPLYGKAYMSPPLNPDLVAEGGQLNNLMNRPAMQQAARNALKIAQEEGRNPTSLGITFNKAGDPVFAATPSWQTLDYMKRGLDDVLNGYRDTTTGRLVLDEGGRAVDQTRRSFLQMLDQNNPDYAAARAAYAGPQQSRGALQQGASVFNKDPDQIASEIAALSPSEQQFYRLGAANALKTQLAKTSSGGDEARALIGNAYRQEQLRRVFPNADQMLAAARDESTMFGTKQALLGGSQTAGRLAEDTSGGAGSVLRPLAEAVTAAATHEPVLAAKSTLTALQELFKNGRITPEVGSKIAEYLLSSDPQTARAWALQAFDRAGTPSSYVRPKLPIIDEFSLLPGERRR